MDCPHSKTCLDYPYLCDECQMKHYPVNGHAAVVRGRSNIVKFKIFWGNHTNVSADAKLNQWLAENPSVELVEWQYQQVRLGDHSICIIYKEKENT